MSDKRHIASLSVDLDNKWSYMKMHGDPGWEGFPSFLDRAVPRILDFLAERELVITVFVVGADAALKKNEDALAPIAAVGHEIGNHSFYHEPWLSRYSEEQQENEIARAAEYIELATGYAPVGFRAPGYSRSTRTLKVLARLGYLYDASSLPTFVGPLARYYFFRTSKLNIIERRKRRRLFGAFKDGFRPLRASRWELNGHELLEVPVTTLPMLRLPIHVSYLIYLGQLAPPLALLYFRSALRMCRLTGTEPSLLLHPLDFLGGDEVPELKFFPGMRLSASKKLAMLGKLFDALLSSYQIVTLREYAAQALQTYDLKGMKLEGDEPAKEPFADLAAV